MADFFVGWVEPVKPDTTLGLVPAAGFYLFIYYYYRSQVSLGNVLFNKKLCFQVFDATFFASAPAAKNSQPTEISQARPRAYRLAAHTLPFYYRSQVSLGNVLFNKKLCFQVFDTTFFASAPAAKNSQPTEISQARPRAYRLAARTLPFSIHTIHISLVDTVI